MKRIVSKYAAWYGNGAPVNINPSRWEKDHSGEIFDVRTGPKTEDEVKEQWGEKVEEEDDKVKKKCPCGKRKSGKKCKCQK